MYRSGCRKNSLGETPWTQEATSKRRRARGRHRLDAPSMLASISLVSDETVY